MQMLKNTIALLMTIPSLAIAAKMPAKSYAYLPIVNPFEHESPFAPDGDGPYVRCDISAGSHNAENCQLLKSGIPFRHLLQVTVFPKQQGAYVTAKNWQGVNFLFKCGLSSSTGAFESCHLIPHSPFATIKLNSQGDKVYFYNGFFNNAVHAPIEVCKIGDNDNLTDCKQALDSSTIESMAFLGNSKVYVAIDTGTINTPIKLCNVDSASGVFSECKEQHNIDAMSIVINPAKNLIYFSGNVYGPTITKCTLNKDASIVANSCTTTKFPDSFAGDMVMNESATQLYAASFNTGKIQVCDIDNEAGEPVNCRLSGELPKGVDIHDIADMALYAPFN
jgi:hypothetical protein